MMSLTIWSVISASESVIGENDRSDSECLNCSDSDELLSLDEVDSDIILVLSPVPNW